MTRSEFEQIAPQLRAQVLKVAQAFFPSHDDAEDVAQETMVHLWQYCDHIDGHRNVSALAVRVAKNCCVSLYRKQVNAPLGRKATGRRTQFGNGRDSGNGTQECSMACGQTSNFKFQTSNLKDPSASPLEQLEAADMQRMVNEVIAMLKPRERQLFEMKQTEGLSTEEISNQTGIPKTSVTVMLSQARKKVLEELKKRMKQ